MTCIDTTTLNGRGCYSVKETEHYYVEIAPMIFNYRVVITPKASPDGYEAGWCYFGRTAASLTRAVLAAAAFDPETETAPVGYDKALGDRR